MTAVFSAETDDDVLMDFIKNQPERKGGAR
jgi:hypothetical protein